MKTYTTEELFTKAKEIIPKYKLIGSNLKTCKKRE